MSKNSDNIKNNSNRLFSKDEIKDIVREFIKAYIRGQISLVLLTPKDIDKNATLLDMEKDPIFQEGVKQRTIILDLINICSGVKESTDEQYNKAINDLYSNIVIFRLNNGIQGSFFTSDIETQLKLLFSDIQIVKKDNEYYKNKIDRTLEFVERHFPRGGE